MYNDAPAWMTPSMIRASEYAGVAHIRRECVKNWSESCYVIVTNGPAASFFNGKLPNIKELV